ncbi:MAG: glyoxalase/bleomycin resistance/extradiol dioxygenase family protein [Chloroflexota bacterium]|nr:glyoxalase/bleomycin resistance/extradiol dioxygenase family protein [Chloroflexota bacterium]
MKLSSFYPVLATDKVTAARDFYVQHFGFAVTFDADWYVSLKQPDEQRPYELAILDYTHPTLPAAYRKFVQGLILNFEVESADAEYARLIDGVGLPLVKELVSEDFGQRHFITVDPSGVLIDVIQIIPPTGASAADYIEKV